MATNVAAVSRFTQPMQRALQNDFLRHGAIVFAATMVVNVLNYAIHFILSRKLGVADYGVFASLMSALVVFGIPANLILTVVAKFVAEFHATEDAAKVRILSLRALALGGCIALSLFCLAVALRRPIAEYLHLNPAHGGGTVLAAAIVLGLTFTVPVMRAVLQGMQDFSRLAASSVIEGFGRLIFGVGLVLFGFGVGGVFSGYAVAMLSAGAVTMVFIRRHWGSGAAPLRINAARLIHTTGGVIVATSAITLLGYIDVPLVKHFFSATDAGIYSAVSVCGKMLFFLVGFVPMLVLPKAARRATAGLEPTRVLCEGLALTGALAALALASFELFSPLLVRITYGAAFLPAAKYVFAYGIAMALLAATNVVVNYKIGLHRYGFVVPLAIMAVVEPAAMQLFHATLWSIIDVLIVGNAVALAGCLSTSALRRLVPRPVKA